MRGQKSLLKFPRFSIYPTLEVCVVLASLILHSCDGLDKGQLQNSPSPLSTFRNNPNIPRSMVLKVAEK